MIAKLTGRVDSVAADHVVIDVGGVGYLVHCPVGTLARLAPGAVVSLAVETRLGDDTIRLYGFLAADEREWFRLLQTVQGVGARMALAVLSALKVNELERAVALSDKAAIGRAQGVGTKLAARIANELKDRAPAVMLERHRRAAAAGAPQSTPAVEADAVAALVHLGYSQIVASEAVAKAGMGLGSETEILPLDALIRESLRQLSR